MSKMEHIKGGSTRVLALLGAVLFLVTSLGFSFFVIWQMHQENQQNKAAADAQKLLQQAQTNQQPKNLGRLSNFTPVAKIDQLQESDTTPGTGQAVQAGDSVTVNYTGALAKDGTIFDSSALHGQSATFKLSEVIPGWQQGMVGMKVGGKRRLLIPAALGYGDQAQQGIPANSDLVFDIELLKIN